MPILLIAAGALGGTALVRWAVREIRRVNEHLDDIRSAQMARARVEPVRRLRRDPDTGAYWPE